ncbi:hypothetical protein [Mesorhizobium sp. Z1-4]|uniref:hypothetical protein n=1 Tax=Mesorhizobium sp. Z1-4 TaxID=2448478 RepID=UPI000FD97EF8|nr:hypothetical protein [Mesorhizobium sp. Z1-4]
MQNLLALPYELQIVLVAGYLGYKVSSGGRDKSYRAEDVLLQILTFGLIARSASLIIAPDLENIAAAAAISIGISVSTGAFWRGVIAQYAVRTVQFLRIYRDDHEPTAWASLTSARAKWTFIQVHVRDGRVLESVFATIPSQGRPSREITLNEDGVVLYVTAIYSAAGERTPQVIKGNDNDFIVTFIPRSEIQQIEVGWKK